MKIIFKSLIHLTNAIPQMRFVSGGRIFAILGQMWKRASVSKTSVNGQMTLSACAAMAHLDKERVRLLPKMLRACNPRYDLCMSSRPEFAKSKPGGTRSKLFFKLALDFMILSLTALTLAKF